MLKVAVTCKKVKGKMLWKNERLEIERKREPVFKSTQIPEVLAKIPLRTHNL